jgi:hypothetical protein
MAFRVFDPKHVRRQKFAKALVHLTKTACRHGAAFEMAIIDPALNGNVRLGFELEGAFFGVFAVVVLEGALDIDGVRIMSLDEVAVVAIHRPHEAGQCGADARRQARPKAGRLPGELDGQISERAPMARIFRNQQRLHQAYAFPPILYRFYVRFHVRYINAVSFVFSIY